MKISECGNIYSVVEESDGLFRLKCEVYKYEDVVGDITCKNINDSLWITKNALESMTDYRGGNVDRTDPTLPRFYDASTITFQQLEMDLRLLYVEYNPDAYKWDDYTPIWSFERFVKWLARTHKRGYFAAKLYLEMLE